MSGDAGPSVYVGVSYAYLLRGGNGGDGDRGVEKGEKEREKGREGEEFKDGQSCILTSWQPHRVTSEGKRETDGKEKEKEGWRGREKKERDGKEKDREGWKGREREREIWK